MRGLITILIVALLLVGCARNRGDEIQGEYDSCVVGQDRGYWMVYITSHGEALLVLSRKPDDRTTILCIVPASGFLAMRDESSAVRKNDAVNLDARRH